MKRFRVRFTPEARSDLVRLYGFPVEKDLDAAKRARQAIETALGLLAFSPFTCRKVLKANPFLRELVIPFGESGYVALFEVDDAKTVTVLALRHQRESDYG